MTIKTNKHATTTPPAWDFDNEVKKLGDLSRAKELREKNTTRDNLRAAWLMRPTPRQLIYAALFTYTILAAPLIGAAAAYGMTAAAFFLAVAAILAAEHIGHATGHDAGHMKAYREGHTAAYREQIDDAGISTPPYDARPRPGATVAAYYRRIQGEQIGRLIFARLTEGEAPAILGGITFDQFSAQAPNQARAFTKLGEELHDKAQQIQF